MFGKMAMKSKLPEEKWPCEVRSALEWKVQ